MLRPFLAVGLGLFLTALVAACAAPTPTPTVTPAPEPRDSHPTATPMQWRTAHLRLARRRQTRLLGCKQ